MMSMLWSGISQAPNPTDPFGRFVYGEVSENYRRVFSDTKHDDYAKSQLLCDAIAGMTESYLLAKHSELKKLLSEAR
jgi:dGTPase